MDIQTTKIELIKHLLNVQKESVLVKIRAILIDENEEIVAHTIKGEPLTKSEYIQQIKEAEDRINKGHFTTHEDLLKNIQDW